MQAINFDTQTQSLFELVKDAARTYPSCSFAVGVKRFGLNGRFQRIHPNSEMRSLIKMVGGKGVLKTLYNDERSRFM